MVERILKYNDVEVKLRLDMRIGIGGDKWPAAELFCDVVTQPRYRDMWSRVFAGKRIVELGSGTGLCGIVIDKLYKPHSIVCTDLLSHVDHMQHNIQLNNDSECGGRCTAMELDWGRCESAGKFDVILAFECVYKPEWYEPLLNTLVTLANPDTLIVLGMTRDFIRPHFFKLLEEKYGLEYVLCPQEAVAGEFCVQNSTAVDTGMFFCKLSPARLAERSGVGSSSK